jgi:hypothetical protein
MFSPKTTKAAHQLDNRGAAFFRDRYFGLICHRCADDEQLLHAKADAEGRVRQTVRDLAHAASSTQGFSMDA